MLEPSFDRDVDIAFGGSITLADYAGVAQDRVLRGKSDIGSYFLNQREKKMAATNKPNYEDDLLEDIQAYGYQEMFEKADNIVLEWHLLHPQLAGGEMFEKADNTVLGFAAGTTAAGAVPLPSADAPLLIGQQAAVMAAISSVFEFDTARNALTSLAAAVIGVGGATVIGKTVISNLLKCIPGAGMAAGSANSAGTAGVIAPAPGKACMEVCKAMKTGKLDQSGLTKKAGLDMLKIPFKEQMKNNKKQFGHPNITLLFLQSGHIQSGCSF